MSSFFHLAPIYHPKYDKTHPEPCQSMLNKVKVAFKFFDYYLSFKDTQTLQAHAPFCLSTLLLLLLLSYWRYFFLPECIWVGKKPTHKYYTQLGKNGTSKQDQVLSGTLQALKSKVLELEDPNIHLIMTVLTIILKKIFSTELFFKVYFHDLKKVMKRCFCLHNYC